MSAARFAPGRGTVALLILALAMDVRAAEVPRVAALVPYVTDALLRLDGQVAVVATVRTTLHEPPRPPCLDLGQAHAPNIETLVESRPTVIVGDAILHAARRDDLARTGAEVLLVRSDTVARTFDDLVRVGRTVGAGERMAALVAEARREVETMATSAARSVLVLFGTPGAFFVVTDRTWVGDLLALLGYQNLGARLLGDERVPGFVLVSDEALVTLRPEIVLLISHGNATAIQAAFAQRLAPGGPLSALGAAARGGVHVLPAHLFSSNPGLALPAAARHLRQLLGPAAPAAP